MHRTDLLKEVLKASVGIGLIVVLINQIDFQKVIDSVGGSNYGYIMIALLAFGMSRLSEGIRFHIFIKRYGFKLKISLKILFVSIFFNNVSSMFIGDGYKLFVLKEKIGSWRSPMALVLLDRLLGFLVLLFIGLIYISFSYSRLTGILDLFRFEVPVNLELLVLAGVLITVLIASLYGNKLKKSVLSILEFFRDLNKIPLELQRHDIFLVIALTIFSHLLIALKIYTLVYALGNEILFIDCLFIIFLLFVATYIPITVGSLGVREGVIVLSLAFFGMSYPDAMAVAVIARIIMYIYAILGGILFLSTKKPQYMKDLKAVG